MHPSCLVLLYNPIEAVLWSVDAAWLCSGLGSVHHYEPGAWGQSTSWIFWVTRLLQRWMFFFFPDGSGTVPGWQCQDSQGSVCEQRFREHDHFHTWISHRRVRTSSPLAIIGMRWRGSAQRSDSPVVSTRSCWELNAALVGNESCDIGEAMEGSATANAWHG